MVESLDLWINSHLKYLINDWFDSHKTTYNYQFAVTVSQNMKLRSIFHNKKNIINLKNIWHFFIWWRQNVLLMSCSLNWNTWLNIIFSILFPSKPDPKTLFGLMIICPLALIEVETIELAYDPRFVIKSL